MSTVRKRALWGWVAGLVVLAAIFIWASMARPTVPDASAAVVGRGGLLLLVAIIPIFLGGRAISKFTADNMTAALVLPVFLAAVLGALVYLFGFVPEDQRLCGALSRYETIVIGPECFTAVETRLAVLAEGYGVWLLFGLVLWGSFRLRDRSERKRLAAIRA